MARLLRFLASLVMLPFAWALCLSLVDSFSLMPNTGGSFMSVEAISLVVGMVTFLVIWMAIPNPVRLYVLGHELTHAVWGMAFGAKASKLRVSDRGGSVQLTKSNVWITLSPYFFPFYTMLVVAAALAMRGVMHFTSPGEPLPAHWLWMFAVGFTWCFHACFTIRSLCERQPDVEEYGRMFSWVLIFICNLAGVLIWMLCTTGLPLSGLTDLIVGHASDAYVKVYQVAAAMISTALAAIRGTE